MKSNYKQLGPFIKQVDIRNKKLDVETLLGVSVQKKFIPSIANTVGTDFTKYKIVERGQFTYIADTSRRGDKIGLAMLDSEDIALVSQAYTVFEIIDHNLLDPEYLMMWYRRPEFDRYARFKSHGSVREIFDWAEMCEIELPIPSIENQREIVAEYNTVVNRIKLNEQLNQKLEETAQFFYENFVNQSIQSDETTIVDFVESANTGLDAIKRAPIVPEDTGIKCLRIQDVSRDKGYDSWGFTNVEKRNFKKFQLQKDDIIIARTGATVGVSMFIKKELNSVFNNGLIRIRANKSLVCPSILYALLNTKSFKEHVESIAFGTSTQPNVKIGELLSFRVSFPPIESQRKIVNRFDALNMAILNNREQISALENMNEIVLAKMTKVELEKEIG